MKISQLNEAGFLDTLANLGRGVMNKNTGITDIRKSNDPEVVGPEMFRKQFMTRGLNAFTAAFNNDGIDLNQSGLDNSLEKVATSVGLGSKSVQPPAQNPVAKPAAQQAPNNMSVKMGGKTVSTAPANLIPAKSKPGMSYKTQLSPKVASAPAAAQTGAVNTNTVINPKYSDQPIPKDFVQIDLMPDAPGKEPQTRFVHKSQLQSWIDNGWKQGKGDGSVTWSDKSGVQKPASQQPAASPIVVPSTYRKKETPGPAVAAAPQKPAAQQPAAQQPAAQQPAAPAQAKPVVTRKAKAAAVKKAVPKKAAPKKVAQPTIRIGKQKLNPKDPEQAKLIQKIQAQQSARPATVQESIDLTDKKYAEWNTLLENLIPSMRKAS